jgi:serine/threonine protein kinase
MEPLRPDDPPAIGQYRLVGRLGAGGMGLVYLGESEFGRKVAVKVIHRGLASDPLFVDRFRHEVEATKAVGHAYTAPVIDWDVDDGQPWLATGYEKGPTLYEAVKRFGPLQQLAVWRLAGGLVLALRAVHVCRIVHRDLTPKNVLLTPDGPKVIDFGISRAAEQTQTTKGRRPIGTPAYMSPEQIETKNLGPASDVFSLGSVIAFSATGEAPFESGIAEYVMHRVVHEHPDLRMVPEVFRELIALCLAKEPGERPTLTELLDLIRAGADACSEPRPVSFWPTPLAEFIDRYDRTELGSASAGSAQPESDHPDPLAEDDPGLEHARAELQHEPSASPPPADDGQESQPPELGPVPVEGAIQQPGREVGDLPAASQVMPSDGLSGGTALAAAEATLLQKPPVLGREQTDPPQDPWPTAGVPVINGGVVDDSLSRLAVSNQALDRFGNASPRQPVPRQGEEIQLPGVSTSDPPAEPVLARWRAWFIAAGAAVLVLAATTSAVLISQLGHSPKALTPVSKELPVQHYSDGLTLKSRWTLAGADGSSLTDELVFTESRHKTLVVMFQTPVPIAAVATLGSASFSPRPSMVIDHGQGLVWSLRFPEQGAVRVSYKVSVSAKGISSARLGRLISRFTSVLIGPVTTRAPSLRLESITIKAKRLRIVSGHTERLTISGLLSNGKPATKGFLSTVLWTTANRHVARINAFGKVSALAAGKTTITAEVTTKTGVVDRSITLIVTTQVIPSTTSSGSPYTPPSTSGSTVTTPPPHSNSPSPSPTSGSPHPL